MRVNRWVGEGLACALLALSAACGNHSEATTLGAACSHDSDCGDAQLCDDSDVCAVCTPCHVLSDCDSGETCSAEKQCCKKVTCADDSDCADPQYCIEQTCHAKLCTADTDCTRANHRCEEGVCKRKDCISHDECITGLCDLTNFVCMGCTEDSDCPESGQTCYAGTCQAGDGDTSSGTLGCASFQGNCLYSTMTCFTHVYPVGKFSACHLLYGADGTTTIGYAFSFADGSVWRQYTQPLNTYEALATDGSFCYRAVQDQVTNVTSYYDANATFLGTYLFDYADNKLAVTCPDYSAHAYDIQTLELGCTGYMRTGLYTPPSPGIEGCLP